MSGPCRADLAWWDLGPGTEVADLRTELARTGVEEWLSVPGLAAKLWISDETARRWGAVMVWDRPAEPSRLPPNRARDLIGRPPDLRSRFRVEGLAVPVPWAGTAS